MVIVRAVGHRRVGPVTATERPCPRPSPRSAPWLGPPIADLALPIRTLILTALLRPVAGCVSIPLPTKVNTEASTAICRRHMC